jgi:hypothetical protein
MCRSVTEPPAARPARSPNDGRDRRVAKGWMLARARARRLPALSLPRQAGRLAAPINPGRVRAS